MLPLPMTPRASWTWTLAVCLSCSPRPPQQSSEAPAPAAPAVQKPASDLAPPRFADAPAPTFTDPNRRALLDRALSAIEERFAKHFKASGRPAFAFGIVIDGKLALSKGYGVRDLAKGGAVDERTVFRIGSVTKVITALAALKLVDQGKLRLDAPAQDYLPELRRLVYPTRDAPPLTVRQLMTHSSGLPNMGKFDDTRTDRGVTEREVLRSLNGFALAYVPGTAVRYSNLGFGVLGLVVGRIAGVPFRDFVSRELLRPLSMNASVWDESAVEGGSLARAYAKHGDSPAPVSHWRLGASEGSGGMYSSVADLARFVAFGLRATPPRNDADPGPVSRAAVRESHRSGQFYDAWLREQSPPSVFASGAAMGWWVHSDCNFDQLVIKDGAMEGYASVVAMLPSRGVGVVALGSYPLGMNAVAKEALQLLLDGGGLAKRQHRVAPLFLKRAKAVTELFESYDAGRYKVTFTDAFQGLVPEPTFRTWMKWQADNHGHCKFDRIIDVHTPTDAAWFANCDRGKRRFQMAFASASDRRFDRVRSTSVYAPPPVVMKALNAALALRPKWSLTKCKKVAGAILDCSQLHAALRALPAQCKTGEAVGGDGKKSSSVALNCGQKPYVLLLRLTDGRIKHVRARSKHAADRCD